MKNNTNIYEKQGLTTAPDDAELISPAEAARMAKLCVKTVLTRWTREIPVVRFSSRCLRFRRRDVLEYIERRTYRTGR
jgi:hypothetical protein